MPRKKRDKLSIAQLKNLYVKKKLSLHKIAALNGTVHSTVYRRLLKIGVKMRSTGCGDHPYWAVKQRGLIYLGSDGRYWIRNNRGKHPRVRSQRLAVARMEEKLGHRIPRGFHVHHKNENHKDDRLRNLELLPKRIHASLHNKGKRTVWTKDKVRIIKRLRERGWSQDRIGKKLRRSQTLISQIIRKYHREFS